MRIPDSVYNVLKWIGLIVLPGCAWLIGQIGPQWNMQNVDAIVVTLNSFGTFVGILIGVSTLEYNKEKGGKE